MSKKDFLISPSILSADFTELGDQIKQAEDAGADWIHIDVMDGHFVPNLSMGPFVVEACRRVTELPLDVHLMIQEPERYLDDFASAGSDYLTVHIETCPEMERTIASIHSLGCKAGITLKPGTGVESIEPYLDLVDLVLVMSVEPGFSGQSFQPASLPRISRLRELLGKLDSAALIQVDGGINPETVQSTYQAGARVFVAASAIFKHPQGIKTGIQSLVAKI